MKGADGRLQAEPPGYSISRLNIYRFSLCLTQNTYIPQYKDQCSTNYEV